MKEHEENKPCVLFHFLRDYHANAFPVNKNHITIEPLINFIVKTRKRGKEGGSAAIYNVLHTTIKNKLAWHYIKKLRASFFFLVYDVFYLLESCFASKVRAYTG